MDDNHFDALSRWLGQLPTRRKLVAGLAGLAGLAAGVALPSDDTAAAAQGARKRKKRGEQAKRRRSSRRRTNVCRPRCKGGAVCRKGKCRCRKMGQSCTTSQGCCGNLLCRGKRCQRPSTPRQTCDVCANGCQFTTVSEAVAAANPGAMITVCPGTYDESPGDESAVIVLDKNLTIQGTGNASAPTNIVLAAAPQPRTLFAVASGVSVTMRRLNLQGAGVSSRYGIRNDGDLTMESCEVRSFVTGVASIGTLTLSECTVTNNTNPSQGGGLFVGGPAQLDKCMVNGNTASAGGGIYIGSAGNVTLTDTTVTGNTATGANGGAGIFAAGVVRLTGTSEVSGNIPDDCAGNAPAEGTCGA